MFISCKLQRKSSPLEEQKDTEAEISASVVDRVCVGRLNEYFRSRMNIQPHPDRKSMLELCFRIFRVFPMNLNGF